MLDFNFYNTCLRYKDKLFSSSVSYCRRCLIVDELLIRSSTSFSKEVRTPKELSSSPVSILF